MMKIIIYFILFFIFFIVNSISASTQKIDSIILNHKIYDFLKKEKFFENDKINIIIRTPFKQKIYCKKPIFSLLTHTKPASLIDMILNCDKKKHYLTVEIQSTGEYIAANKYIPHGTKIQASDLQILIGRLDKLPNHTYRKKKDVIGRVNLRDVFPLQPITSLMTHPFWLVEVNQQVKIIIKGKNFIISSKAKSLNNGAKNEIVRVKTNTGKIINGIVSKYGEVIIFFS